MKDISVSINTGDIQVVSVRVSPLSIVDHVANKIDKAMELPPGAGAGSPPDANFLAAVAIDALSDFSLLDGAYFAIVEVARGLLTCD